MRLDRAAMVRRLRFGGVLGIVGRVVGVGVSWAVVWLALWVSLRWALKGPVTSRAMLGMVSWGLLFGIPFGVVLAIAGRGHRASKPSLVRTLTSALLACALTQALYLGYLGYLGHRYGEDLVGFGVWSGLVMCVLAQCVTILWYAAVRGGTRALALLGPRA